MGEGVNDGHCQSPDNRRIDTRREKLGETWESEEWKTAKAAGIIKNPTCWYCGDKTQVPHHEKYEVYGHPEYLNLDDTQWLCNICHDGVHKGKFQCPICGKVRSTVAGTPCYRCLGESDKRRIREGKQARNDTRNQHNRKRYRITHPRKKVDPKTGKWITIKGHGSRDSRE